MEDYECLVDESGDEAKLKGSRWFVMGGLVLPKSLEQSSISIVQEIKEKLKVRTGVALQWKRHRDHRARQYIVHRLANNRWTFIAVLINTHDRRIVTANGLRSNVRTYHYAARLLLERVSWHVRKQGGGMCNVTFEQRKTMNYQPLRDYLRRLMSDPRCSIDWRHIDPSRIRAEQKHALALLQASDCFTGATATALEVHKYGLPEPIHLQRLSPRLYRGANGVLIGNGLKFMPSAEDALYENPWLKQM